MVLTADQIQFIHGKVFFEVGHGGLAHDDRAMALFIARLLTPPDFADKIRTMVQPAYTALSQCVTGSNGMVLE